MKASTLILSGSVLLNLALAALWLRSPADDSSAATRVAAPAPARSAPAPRTPGPEAWAALATDDLAQQRDRLRAEGFPPEIVRAILAAQIRERFAERRKALEAAQASAPFWKTSSVASPAQMEQMRALAREEAAALKELLGADPDNYYAARARRDLPNLPADKLEQVVALRERYDEQRQKIYSGRVSTPDDREKILALEKSQHAELAAILSPAELEDYDLRASNVANNLRYNLAAFDATEAEFRALYRLQSAFEDTAPRLGAAMSTEESRARGLAQRQLNDDIKAALGDARYADYQRSTNYDYKQSTQLVARLGLPPEAANQIYLVQQEISSRASELRRDTAVNAPQLAALNNEAQQKITAILGPVGYEAYKQYSGSWLQIFNPPQPPQPPRPRPAN